MENPQHITLQKLKHRLFYDHSPTANTQSYPDCTKVRASMRAVDPEEQLLLTLNTGTPVRPISKVEAMKVGVGTVDYSDQPHATYSTYKCAV